MRGSGWTSSELIRSSRGMAEGNNSNSSPAYNPFLASKAMKLKLSGQISREISERRQVGDAENMFKESREGEGMSGKPWWRNVGMEEGM
jgi:pyruvate dehydrogenase kinase 2/3/4